MKTMKPIAFRRQRLRRSRCPQARRPRKALVKPTSIRFACVGIRAWYRSGVSAMELADAERLLVGIDLVDETWRAVSRFGEMGCEGLALWLGELGDGVAQVTEVLVPPQVPLREEGGVGYFVPGDTLARLNRELYARRVRLLAQVHSHPGEAYHSTTDDRYAVVTEEGGFSLVIPWFGRLRPFQECALFRLEGGRWIDQSDRPGIISSR